MKVVFSALIVISLLATSVAYCPNGCNGQGTCGANDKCTCYLRADVTTDPAYTGADCSLRTCPKGVAWVDEATATNVAHASVECSNQGLCDREAGSCECFPGYEGKACERSTCPNNCNGRGVCQNIGQMLTSADSYDGTYTSAGYASSIWDSDKHMGCLCDTGYRGPDCSEMECPSGTDVLLGHGKTQGRDCGGRGLCNRETGNCECFPGYYGTACGSQTTVF